MAQQSYTGQQPKDGDDKVFAGLLADHGGTSEFIAPAGSEPYNLPGGGLVSDQVVAVSRDRGAGETSGFPDDVAVDGDSPGTHSAKLRGLLKLLGVIGDAKVITDTAGSLIAMLRGLVYFAERFNAVLGQTSDVALTADQSGTINAHTRSLTKQIGDTTDAGVTTDTNGTASAKLRGLIILLVNLLSRWPATLGQKTMAGSLPVVLPNDQSAIPVSGTVGATQSGAWNVTNVSGSISLPTGASTEATLLSANTKLATLQPSTSAGYGNAVPVTTSPTPIIGVTAGRKEVRLTNSETALDRIVWLGFDTTVTPGKAGKNIGPLYPGGTVPLHYAGAVYGICDSGTAYVAPAELL